ncbi:DNA-binding IclR family transcriptional regulator [Rhodococcus sp. 27YEA15]|uniref:IclR family transcriptional regulator n=1 Tax=Rhodococcus sp. 27YEA15 TaxID=3156259 RepID=UPI003C7AEDE7
MSTTDSAAPKRERNPIRSLTRLLSTMVESEERSFGTRELARALDTAPSSVQRTLETAQEVSLVAPDGSGGWELGWELFRIASLASSKQPFGSAQLYLEELRDACGETAVLTVYDPQRAARMFVVACPSRHAVRFVPEVFEWMPMHAGATAFTILAHRPESERRAIYDKGFPRLTDTTPTSADQIEEVLADVLVKGYAITRDEVAFGANAIAAPIITPLGVTSSIAVITPVQRYTEELEERVIGLVTECATKLASRLGHPSAHVASMK